MNREPKVVIVDTANLRSNDPIGPSAIFDDAIEETDNDVPEIADKPKEKKPPGPIGRFIINNKGWLIASGVLLLIIVSLALTIYFINIKCNTTVREERDKATRLINDLEEQSSSACTARDKYCEEAQRLRSQLRELSDEYDRLKTAPPPKPVNRLQQKKIIQEYSKDGTIEPPRQKKPKKVTFAEGEEAISVDLPKPSTNKRKEIEEAVTLNSLNGADDMDAVVTAPDEEFDEDIIDM